MIPEKHRLTYQDLCKLPAHISIHELIDGELFIQGGQRTNHQSAKGEIMVLIATYLHNNPIGEILPGPLDIIFSNENVAEPDIVYISNERRHIITAENIQGAPDLIIEILSVDNPDYDRKTKKQFYWRFKVPHYWIVEPDKGEIEIYRWAQDGYQLAGNYKKGDRFEHELFPGMVFDTEQIFAYLKTFQ